MKYDLILLDADGTLFDFDAAAAAAFRATCVDAGIVEDTPGNGEAGGSALFDRYYEINHRLWEALERGEIDKESLKVERFRRLFAERNIAANAAACSERYLAHLAEGAQLLAGAESFARAIAASGARLAIVTNGVSSVQRGRFFRSPLAALIPHLFISEELGAEKPAAAFFAEAFRRLGRSEAEKEGVIVIGDSWSADVAGALGFGLDALWFNPTGKESPVAVLRPEVEGVKIPDPRGGREPKLYEAATYEAALSVLESTANRLGPT